MPYDLQSLKVPQLSGKPLKTLVNLLENGYSRRLLESPLLKEGGLHRLRALDIQELPTHQPKHPAGRAPSPEQARASLSVLHHDRYQAPETPGFRLPTAFDYARAYRAGDTTPVAIAEKIIAAIRASNSGDKPLNAVINFNEQNILAQARESLARIQTGRPLSVLDGVPVAIKDELDLVPYATTVGTQVLGQDASAEQDATAVARLRAAGALFIGKTNMQEVGLGVTGANAHFGVCRNPYNPAHHTGGSSSGSAAAVAAGLCPIALGADGGGSVRIPAALCGVVGLKPTWSRVSEFGAAPLCWSVAHVGPIGASVDDVALAYSLIAGPDTHDPWSLEQPAVHLQDYLKPKLEDVRFGVYLPWFNHGSRDLVQTCQLALERLKSRGATMHHIEIGQLDAQRLAHTVTIASEMLAALDGSYRRERGRFGLETRLNLALAHAFSSRDYIKSQQIRTYAIRQFQQAFQKVDVIVTPTTGIAAPRINEKALPEGESNLGVLTELMRFATPANLTGYPALTLPVGYTPDGLPIGLQLIGRPWEEHLLLRVARNLEQLIERKRPTILHELLAR